MSAYYTMRLKSDPKVTGVREGRQAVIPKIDSNRPFFEYFSRYDYLTYIQTHQPPSVDLELHNVKAYKPSKMTSFLSFSPFFSPDCYFLVNDEVKQCFDQFNVQKHRFYKANVIHLDKPYTYWLFYMPSLGYEVIDFKKTVFYSGGTIIENRKYHSADSIEKYRKIQNVDRILLSVEKISFNEIFDQSLDLFQAKLGGLFVSERFKSAILEAGFSNVNFFPAFGGDLRHVQVEVSGWMWSLE